MTTPDEPGRAEEYRDPAAAGGPTVPWDPPPNAAAPVAWEPPGEDPAVPGAEGLVYASVGTRALAYLVDVVIQTALALLLMGVTGTAPAEALSGEGADLAGPTILSVAISFVYMVGLWTSPLRATLGQRLLAMWVVDGASGATLRRGQAVRRWIALGEPIALASVVSSLVEFSTYALFGWLFVVLVTIARHPTRLGLHDRFAGSAVVRPVGVDMRTRSVVAVIVVTVAIVGFAIWMLAMLGDQLEQILLEAGELY